MLTEFEYLMAEETKPGHGPEFAALNGLQRRTATFSLDGSPLQHLPYRVEECDHELKVLGAAKDGRQRVFYAVTAYRTEDRERTTDVRLEEKTYTYDGLGNVTRERLRGCGMTGGAAVAARERVTDIEYASTTVALHRGPAVSCRSARRNRTRSSVRNAGTTTARRLSACRSVRWTAAW